MFRADLTAVNSLISRPHILDCQSPLSRPLVVVDRDSRIRSEIEQTDRQRMYVISFTPRDL